ncbi:hypothetical protein AAII07_28820 [Microvirga sp. 0TCS3.31]
MRGAPKHVEPTPTKTGTVMSGNWTPGFPTQLAISAGGFAVVGVVVSLVVFWKEWDLVGLAFLVAGAAGSLGAVTGFVFGIPKLAENPQGAEGFASLSDADKKRVLGQRLLFNTNLGEVSDWLTKIVVGLSLVQFDEIIDGAGWLADRYSNVFDAGALDASGAAVFGMAVTVSSASFSFILTYLWTSVRLPQEWDKVAGG